MKPSLIVFSLILSAINISGFAQEREIFPDYIDIGDIPIIGTIEFIDAATDSAKRVIWYDQEGRISKEQFTNYQPVNGKYIIDGTYLYKYGNGLSALSFYYFSFSIKVIPAISA